MSEETKQRKSGRTAEQQAARDARKAAKKAAVAAEAATVEETEPKAGPTTSEAQTDTEVPASRKRRAQEEDDADLLEIDLKADAPLSKAEQRAAKKRAKRGEAPLPPKKSVTEEADKAAAGGDSGEGRAVRKGDSDKPRPQAKGEFSIWIGNLSFRTTEDALKEFLVRGIVDSGGEEDAVTRVHMPKKAGHGTFAQNKGFAYVDFKTDALRLLAIGLTERPLEGRKVLIKAGDDHKANPDARTPKPLPSGPGTMGPQVLAKQKHGESSTLFIGNLPFDVTEDELRDLVEGNAEEIAGGVEEEDEKEDEKEDADEDDDSESDKTQKQQPNSRRGVKSGLIKTRLAQFEDTGRCKGFAFWDFETPAHAKAALLNRRNHNLRGRRLNLQFASTEATNRSGAAKKKAREQEERDGLRAPRRERERPAKRPRYFDGEGAGGGAGEGEGEDGEYESRTAGHAGPRDFKSEKDAASRIAAMVASGGGDAADFAARPERRRGQAKWEQAGRPRPGAALAMAKREKVGIVASTGSKVTFD